MYPCDVQINQKKNIGTGTVEYCLWIMAQELRAVYGGDWL